MLPTLPLSFSRRPDNPVLNDHNFSDAYLGESHSWLSGVPGTKDPIPAPEDCAEELVKLRNLCIEGGVKHRRDEFAVRYSDRTYRVSTLVSLKETVFVLRRFPEVVPDLHSLGLHDGHIAMLMQPGLSGLLVISGAYSQGKTTTASSLIVSRLSKSGGVAVTLEDPPEMPLEGRHGEGVCYQTWAKQGELDEACRRAARWAPSIIFVGEVRDPETAAEAVRASINGRLVICTTHADNVISTVERLFALSLSSGILGSPEDVAGLLSSGLIGVLHQRLEGDPKTLKIEFLWTCGEDSTGVRNQIKTKNFRNLGSEIDLQLKRMLRTPKRQGV